MRPVKALVFATVYILVPLAGNVARMLHPTPWLYLFAFFVTLWSFPPIPSERFFLNDSDRHSGNILSLTVLANILALILDYTYGSDWWDLTSLKSPVYWSGLVVLMSALFLRVWSIRTLGKCFTFHVQGPQTLVDYGVYKNVRHPSYTAVIFELAGASVMSRSTWGWMALMFLVIPAFMYRIRVEEAQLRSKFPSKYDEYKQRSWTLVPLVF